MAPLRLVDNSKQNVEDREEIIHECTNLHVSYIAILIITSQHISVEPVPVLQICNQDSLKKDEKVFPPCLCVGNQARVFDQTRRRSF